MTLLELQSELKKLSGIQDPTTRKTNVYWLIQAYTSVPTDLTDLAQLIISAKIKQPGTPKKYFTEYERWSYKIDNAYIFDKAKYAEGVAKDLSTKKRQLRCEPYKHGFILVKPEIKAL